MDNPCSFCPASCCKTYTITTTSFDILRISRRSGFAPEAFALFHPVKLLSYDADTVLDFKEGSGILGIKSHPCFFLGSDNLCQVHKYAPLSCRRYPFTVKGKMNTRFCPLPASILFRFKKPDIGSEQLVHELQEYKKIVKEWNKKPGEKKDCLKYLLEKSIL